MFQNIDWANLQNPHLFINGDCMEYMKTMPDKYVDLCICDPPYGIGEDGSKNHTRGKLATSKNYKPFAGNDIEPPNKAYFKELFRVSKNQIIFGANHFIDLMPYRSSCWVVWDKDNGNNDFADCELAWTSFKTAVRKYTFRWKGMLQGDMKNKEHRIHPTQKPVALYKWLLNKYAKQGDKILDTHVGSASSLIACFQLGFDYVGFEIDKDYYESAQTRLHEAMLQPSMLKQGDF
jgi:site-specific DNA-methyltransferase (adenine-specific)